MKSLVSRIPDAEVVLALEPEELGWHVLQLLQEEKGQVILTNSIEPLSRGYETRVDQIRDAIAEAWAWLETQLLLVPAWRAGGSPPWRVLSRRARSLSSDRGLAAVLHGALLPKAFLHPRIPAQVWPNFMKGDLDAAVSQAMKQVEIAIRDATPFKDETSGVKLARKAFHTENGPLTDTDAEGGERSAMMELFTGALGTMKNPHSHRNVSLTDPGDAAAAILLASYLLRVVDQRAAAKRS